MKHANTVITNWHTHTHTHSHALTHTHTHSHTLTHTYTHSHAHTHTHTHSHAPKCPNVVADSMIAFLLETITIKENATAYVYVYTKPLLCIFWSIHMTS